MTTRAREDTLRYLADPSNWLGDPHDHAAVLLGHFTPFELAEEALESDGADDGSGIVGEIKRLSPVPGDVVVVRLLADMVDGLLAKLGEAFPHDVQVLIVGREVDDIRIVDHREIFDAAQAAWDRGPDLPRSTRLQVAIEAAFRRAAG